MKHFNQCLASKFLWNSMVEFVTHCVVLFRSKLGEVSISENALS